MSDIARAEMSAAVCRRAVRGERNRCRRSPVFFNNSELAETIPGRLGAFAFDAPLVGDEADAFTQIIALEFGGLHHRAINAPLAEDELHAGKRHRRESDEGEELKGVIHFVGSAPASGAVRRAPRRTRGWSGMRALE